MSVSQIAVDQLVAMGFTAEASRNALLHQKNDIQRALDWLFDEHKHMAANLATQSPRNAVAAVAPAQHPRPAHIGAASHPRIVHKSSARAHEPTASSSSSHPAFRSPASLSDSLPPGFRLGRVSKFWEQNKDGVPGSGYGFLAPDSATSQDLYFQWRHVLSERQPWPPTPAQLAVPPQHPLKYAYEYPDEAFLQSGDLVAYRTIVRPNYIPKGGGAPMSIECAVDLKLLEMTRGSKYRRTQAAAAAGENAPMQRIGSAASSSAASSSSQPFVPAASAVPSAPLSTLIGSRMRGVIHQLSPLPQSTPADPADRIQDKSKATKMHGLLAVHHISCESVFFFLADFRESKHQQAAAVNQSAGTIAAQLRSKLHIGDVVEFTLSCDPVIHYTAKDIAIVPTLSYAQVEVEERRRRQQEQIGLRSDLKELEKIVPLVYIAGSVIEADESRHLEFKSLTRSASAFGLQMNLGKLADKYMNSFLNSSGGVLLFGIEDNGQVAGLPLNKKQRNELRTSVDGFMNESTPSVSPEYYAFRFCKVAKLYKSSWVGTSGLPGGASLGQTILQDAGPEEVQRQMVDPHPFDKVEILQTVVVAIITAPGAPHTLYQTSGRGHASKDSFMRREGSSIRMTPVDIANFMAEKQRQQQAQQQQQVRADGGNDVVQRVLEDIEQSKKQDQADMIAQIVQQVEAKLKMQYDMHPAPVEAAPPAAAAAPSPKSADNDDSSSSCSDDFVLPTQLLSVLLPMSFSRAAILEACYQLHEAREVDWRKVYKRETPEEVNAEATDKVLNILLAKINSPQASPTPKEERARSRPISPLAFPASSGTAPSAGSTASVSSASPSSASALASTTAHPASASTPRTAAQYWLPDISALPAPSRSALSSIPALPPRPSRVEEKSDHAAHDPSQHQHQQPQQPLLSHEATWPEFGVQEFEQSRDFESPSAAPMLASSARAALAPSSAAVPAAAAAEEIQIPCEVCTKLCSFEKLDLHQRQCRSDRQVAQQVQAQNAWMRQNEPEEIID